MNEKKFRKALNSIMRAAWSGDSSGALVSLSELDVAVRESDFDKPEKIAAAQVILESEIEIYLSDKAIGSEFWYALRRFAESDDISNSRKVEILSHVIRVIHSDK